MEWNLIKEWNNLSDNKKLTALMAVIIVCLVSVCVYKDKKIEELETAHKKELREVNKKHLDYVLYNEREFKGLYFELQKLRDK